MLAGADRPDRCVATTPLDGWGTAGEGPDRRGPGVGGCGGGDAEKDRLDERGC
jgi:hypothetical protein